MPLTIFAERLTLDVWQSYNYASKGPFKMYVTQEGGVGLAKK